MMPIARVHGPRERLARSTSAAVASPWFTRIVIATIVINSALLAIETDVAIAQRYGMALGLAHAATLVAFAIELALRFLAHGREWRTFFRDSWTRFDLLVFTVSLIPAIGPLASVARVARVLRVARIVSVSPKLRLIIATMARSIPSLAHVGLLLGLLLFVYGVIGTHLFRAADPTHWGSLGTALLTLFQMLTLEGWVELQRTSMAAEPRAWLFYGSFVLVAVFVVVNLFVAVVLSNLDQARRDLADDSAEPTLTNVMDELRALRAQVDATAARQVVPQAAEASVSSVGSLRSS